MLILIFNRAATGAITGSITTEQPRQQDIASGAVVEPVVHVVGGGAGGGLWQGRLLPHFTTKIPAVSGTCKTQQRRQESQLTGDMIDVELELVAAIMLAAIA